jgi:rubrerythrin
MKIKFILVSSVLAAAFLIFGHISAQRSEKRLNEQTLKNLSTAMHGEAFAHAKYLLFAEHARKSGDTELAKLLEETAKTERFEHFAEEAELAGLVRSDMDNLKDAIRGESYETEIMYRNFAKQAEQVGDHAAAQRFEEIRQDELRHRAAFNATLANLEKKSKTTHH